MPETTSLDITFAALANPTRRAILARLLAGKANVNELAEPFDMSLPAISKHIRILQRAGLITQEQKAQFRPCTLNTYPLEALSSWTEQYRHIWDARLTQIDICLENLQEQKNDT